MENVTVYFGSSDLDRIQLQLLFLTIGIMFLGVIAVRALEGIRDALMGKALEDLRDEVVRLKADTSDKYDREDLKEAFDAGIEHATDDEALGFDAWLTEYDSDDA